MPSFKNCQALPNVLTYMAMFIFMITGGFCLELRPKGYDHHLPPRAEDGGPLTVSLSVMISSVNEVNENDMELAFCVYFRTAWTDTRLVIPQDIFNGSDSMIIGPEILEDLKLWRPDPFIEKVKKIETATMLQPFAGLRLHKDGKILMSHMFIITLSCPMFFQNFPFDTQTCHLEIASYFYDINDIRYGWHSAGISTSDDIPTLLGDYEFAFKMKNTTICSVPGYVNGVYPCLKAYMKFKRRYKNYLIGVYVPSLLFVAVAWASFFWPPEAVPARTVLLITCLLTMISLYSSVQAATPPANYTRAIDTWFFACILAVATALFQYAIILQIRLRSERAPQNLFKVADKNSVSPSPGNLSVKELSSRNFWKKAEQRVELGARIFYVIAFFFFNICYWSIYLT